MMSTDIVVAGGGVAGLLIASALAPEFPIILLEERDDLPRNKYWLSDETAVTDNPDLRNCVDRRYTAVDFIANDGLTAVVEGNYCLWDTDKLINHLTSVLSAYGVQMFTKHAFYSLRQEPGKIIVRANSKTIEAKLFIDCMGFNSPLVGAKSIATILGYYIVHGKEVVLRRDMRPVGLDNVVIDRHPAFFELFPTSKGTAHAAIILPSRQHRLDRSLTNELSFILRESHYAEDILEESGPRRNYFGIVPVGRLHQTALERVVFFGEAGQCNPAASATGLSRMLRVYRDLAQAIKACLKRNTLSQTDLIRAMPASMTAMNRIFHERLFESILSFTSDDFRRIVKDLKEYPNNVINDMLFAEFPFTPINTLRLGLGALVRRDTVLASNVLRSIGRFCLRRLRW